VQSALQQVPLVVHALPSPRQEPDAPAAPAPPLDPPPAGAPPAVALPPKTSGERLASFATKPAPLEDDLPVVASSTPPSPRTLESPDAPPQATTTAATPNNTVDPLLTTMPFDLGQHPSKRWTQPLRPCEPSVSRDCAVVRRSLE
jgi:hypothetical protein